MRLRVELCLLAVLNTLSACSITLSPVIAPSELDTTERGAFTDDGRFFVIGSRPAGRNDAGEWIVELTKGANGAYAATNYLAGTTEGTSDGTLTGSPAGEPCKLSGMKAQGKRIYAACVAANSEWRAALLEIDTQTRSVRAGYFTTCNAEPASSPCEPLRIYPNGVSIDSAGRIYVSNMIEHLRIADDIPSVQIEGTGSIRQIIMHPSQRDPRQLEFTHRAWYGADIITDGLSPNGIQIEGETLYYAAGSNINRVEIASDGRAGPASVHYTGPALTYIDDFAVLNGRMLLARTIPPELVALDAAPQHGSAKELGTQAMGLDAIPSSVTYQADIPQGNSLFPAGTAIITCEFGGGLYLASASGS